MQRNSTPERLASRDRLKNKRDLIRAARKVKLFDAYLQYKFRYGMSRYILYAEDDTDDQQDMRRMVYDIDPSITLLVFNNGLELVQYLTELKSTDAWPMVIFLDVNMPIWDGVRTLQTLKSDAHLNMIPVIMWSTSTLQRDIDLAERQGATSFITKPVHHDEWVNVKTRLSAFFRTTPSSPTISTT